MEHLFLKEFTSQYNHANEPMITIYDNCKIDIVEDFNDDNKISLLKGGVLKFIKSWLLLSGYHLSKEERIELKNIIDNLK